MAKQLDLTYYEEGFNHPLGAVFTVYEDGDMLVTSYDIRHPWQGEPESESTSAWVRTEDVVKLMHWIQTV